MPRITTTTDEYILFRRSDVSNKTLCVLIHGFSGNHTDKYWGTLPESLIFEQSVQDFDILFWGYPSSKSPFANYFSLIKRGKKISTLREVSDSLITTLLTVVQRYSYEKVLLMGHSMGGLVCVMAARALIDEELNFSVERLCLMATPQSPPALAKWLATLGGNPHLKYMSSWESMNMLFRAVIPNLEKSNIPVTYMRYTLDELVSLDSDIQFHKVLAYNVKHHWFLKGNPSLQAYEGIVRWIERG